MNKKEYNAIANILNRACFITGLKKSKFINKKSVVTDLADYFEGQQYITGVYVKFNRQQFLKDCGVEK